MNYTVSCFNTPNHDTYIGLTPKRLGNYITCLFTIKNLIGKYHCRAYIIEGTNSEKNGDA